MTDEIMAFITGTAWTESRPYTHKRWTLTRGEWTYSLSDLGCASLYGLVARNEETGEVYRYNHDFQRHRGGDGVEGWQSAFGTAYRHWANRFHPGESDRWEQVDYPDLFDTRFTTPNTATPSTR